MGSYNVCTLLLTHTSCVHSHDTYATNYTHRKLTQTLSVSYTCTLLLIHTSCVHSHDTYATNYTHRKLTQTLCVSYTCTLLLIHTSCVHSHDTYATDYTHRKHTLCVAHTHTYNSHTPCVSPTCTLTYAPTLTHLQYPQGAHSYNTHHMIRPPQRNCLLLGGCASPVQQLQR